MVDGILSHKNHYRLVNSMCTHPCDETAMKMLCWCHFPRLYSAYPLPPRKIKKCFAKKREAALRKGRAHIRRVVQIQMERWDERVATETI